MPAGPLFCLFHFAGPNRSTEQRGSTVALDQYQLVKIAAKVLQSAFAKAPGEKLVAFVSIGTPARTPAKRTPASIEKHFSIWDGSSC